MGQRFILPIGGENGSQQQHWFVLSTGCDDGLLTTAGLSYDLVVKTVFNTSASYDPAVITMLQHNKSITFQTKSDIHKLYIKVVDLNRIYKVDYFFIRNHLWPQKYV